MTVSARFMLYLFLFNRAVFYNLVSHGSPVRVNVLSKAAKNECGSTIYHCNQ